MRIIIEAGKPANLGLRELWHYRDLFWVLAYRDLRVRYAQTFLGLLWVVLQPVTTLFIFVIVFGVAVKVETGDIPYPLFALSGLTMWTYFSAVLSQAGSSVIGAQQMIQKIYFPRLVIPLSKATVAMVDYAVAFLFLLIMLIWYGYTPSANLFFLPIFLFVNMIAALGMGIWVSALTIRYRDFQHVIPFLVQFGLYATPVGYPASLIPEKYQALYFLNPMAGIVEGTRWCFFGGQPIPSMAYLSFGIVLVLFFSGIIYFRRLERIMADII